MRGSSRIGGRAALLLALCSLALPAAAGARPADGTADVGVTATISAAKVFLGQNVTFTYTVVNNGPDRANVVQLIATISARATLATITPPAGIGCRTRGQTVTCTFPFLEPKQTATVTIVAQAKVAGGLTGAATVTVVETDPDPTNQQVSPGADILAPDSTAPTEQKIGRLDSITLKLPATVTWSATDVSGIQGFKVRYRSANPAGAFGPPVPWKQTAEKTAPFTGKPGATYCFSVSATDFAGNTSAYGLETCTVIPLGASSFIRRGAWKLVKSSQFYRGFAASTTTAGATLSLRGITANRLVVYFARCPECGKVQATWRGRVIANFKTTGNVRYGNPMEIFTSPAVQTGDLILTVMGKRSKLVQIEGIAVGKAPAAATP